MNGIEIDEKTYLGLNEDQRAVANYNALISIHREVQGLKKQQWWNKVASFAGGIVGGIAAWITAWGIKP